MSVTYSVDSTLQADFGKQYKTLDTDNKGEFPEYLDTLPMPF